MTASESSHYLKVDYAFKLLLEMNSKLCIIIQ